MIFIITGEIETGKSTALLKWIKARKAVYGILTLKDENEQRYILDVNTQEVTKMQARTNHIDTISVGRYHFYKSAFIKANSILIKAVKEQNNGFILIDELGKLELLEEGLHKSAQLVIKKTKYHQTLHCILVIRLSLLNTMINKYNISNSKVLSVDSIQMIKN